MKWLRIESDSGLVVKVDDRIGQYVPPLSEDISIAMLHIPILSRCMAESGST
jgi:hypothetical protein